MLTSIAFNPNRIGAVSVAALLASAPMAGAAVFEIDFSGGANTVIGTFEAPVGGGAVSNLMVTLSGVTFDTMLPGTLSLEYDPSVFDFTYAGSFPSYTNSAAAPGLCGIGSCFLEIYPETVDPMVPGDYLAIDDMLNNIDAGTKYIINPVPIDGVVPLPPALALLLGSLAMLGLAGKGRSAV